MLADLPHAGDMATYAQATVFFPNGFTVGVDDTVYNGEVPGLSVRLDGDWVYIKADPAEARVDTFHASVIACISWDEEEE